MSRIVPPLLFVLLIAGCEAPGPAAKPVPPRAAPASVTRAPARPIAATPPAAPVVIDEPAGTPQSLANDASAYVRTVEEQLVQRQQQTQRQAPISAHPPRPRADAPDVTWLDSRDVRLTLDPPIQPVQIVQPEAAQPPAAWITPAFNPAKAIQPPATQPASSPPPAAPPDELESNLSRRIETHPRDLIAHLDYQLLRFLRGQPVPQLTAISPLAPEDREIVAAILDALTNFRTAATSAEAGGLPSRRIRPLVELAERLRAASSLGIPTARLCRRVDGFGSYEPIDARFPAGREKSVILYCEIENFASRQNAAGLWETRLALETTLYDARGARVAAEPPRPVIDLSRNRRRDFFARGVIRIPALAAGHYSLTVTVTDTHANRIAECRVPVEITP